LAAAAPPPRPSTLTHGDFRLGNVMFAPGPPVRVQALLDWELAGAGDPLTDLGYLVATYAQPDAPPHALTELGPVSAADGFPSRAELVARYAASTGTKLAVLFEYQRRRWAAGHGDPYYARPELVDGLLHAGRAFLTGEVAP
jgi:aminoglycoside phosphotransferase (APT) family kinase protein